MPVKIDSVKANSKNIDSVQDPVKINLDSLSKAELIKLQKRINRRLYLVTLQERLNDSLSEAICKIIEVNLDEEKEPEKSNIILMLESAVVTSGKIDDDEYLANSTMTVHFPYNGNKLFIRYIHYTYTEDHGIELRQTDMRIMLDDSDARKDKYFWGNGLLMHSYICESDSTLETKFGADEFGKWLEASVGESLTNKQIKHVIIGLLKPVNIHVKDWDVILKNQCK